MMEAGKYPPRYMPDFLHEFVHHWCFHSPVGAALALLQMRAFRNAMLLRDREIDEESALRIAEDAFRYEAAVSLMRPLAEGLALFAEFDAAPGDSLVLSMVSLAAGISFLDTSGPDVTPAASWKQLSRLLATRRMDEDFCERKANLLVQPFHGGKGGYLPGYLTVKSLRLALIRRMQSGMLYDADLFLTYMRSFFYEDFGLVAELLDPDTALDPGSGDDSIQAIAIYFQKRFGQLALCTTGDTLKTFEMAVSSGQGFDWSKETVGGDPRRGALGREWLQHMVEEIDFDGPPKSFEGLLKRNDHFVFAQRDLMCIASFQAPVEVNKHGRVLVGEYRGDNTGDFAVPLVSLPGLEEATPGRGDGSLEFFLSVHARYSLSVVTLDDKVVAVNSLSDNFTEQMKKQVTGYWTSQAGVTSQRKLRLATIERALSEPTVAVYRQHYRENNARIAEEFFATRGLLFTPDSHLDRCLELLRENGFYGLLRDDPDLVRKVALVSLVASFTSDRELAAELLAERSVDLNEVLVHMKSCWENHNLPIVLDHSARLLWSYV